MKLLNIANGPRNASAVVLGCMRMPRLSVDAAAEMLRTAVDEGVNFFDHATCYGNGEAETRFGDAFKLAGLRREDVYIQSKCGLHFDRQEFDWSRDDIITSAEESLVRLKTEYLDVLLLHRPDLLYEPEQVAEAFETLHVQGKVRYFGVSNVSPGQLELLGKYVKQPLVINQLQFSLDQAQLIDTGLYVNNLTTEHSVDRDNGLIDYCRLKDITIQAWSPLQAGMFQGCFVDDPGYPELNKALGEVAEKYFVSKTAIAIAWILRHPARMQAIAGTMNPSHLKDICAGSDIVLTHQEWYKLYLASGRKLP
ncbi:MAG: aldo/keto reductase [Clostridiales bacterium]|nr:aldo/keto reductase [Clostridiales bacterium]